MAEIISLIQANPHASIIILAALVTLFITAVNYFIMDKEKMRELKSRQKELNKQMKEHQKAGNHEKVKEWTGEIMPMTMEMMKHSFKPMIITFIPIIIFFSFIRSTFAETTLAATWFWWYLGTAMISSILFRKLFKLP
ncbi:MAG: DUF106 domain-containing protein [Nanoarchaeota archaeon]|nr:DUF106 domain-containing protein [Nanoarchaeota archaeon]